MPSARPSRRATSTATALTIWRSASGRIAPVPPGPARCRFTTVAPGGSSSPGSTSCARARAASPETSRATRTSAGRWRAATSTATPTTTSRSRRPTTIWARSPTPVRWWSSTVGRRDCYLLPAMRSRRGSRRSSKIPRRARPSVTRSRPATSTAAATTISRSACFRRTAGRSAGGLRQPVGAAVRQQSDLSAGDARPERQLRDAFGRSLASGDFDGDGRDDLAIGDPRMDFTVSGNCDRTGGRCTPSTAPSAGRAGLVRPGRTDFLHQGDLYGPTATQHYDGFGHGARGGRLQRRRPRRPRGRTSGRGPRRPDRGGVTILTGDAVDGLAHYFRFLSPGLAGFPGVARTARRSAGSSPPATSTTTAVTTWCSALPGTTSPASARRSAPRWSSTAPFSPTASTATRRSTGAARRPEPATKLVSYLAAGGDFLHDRRDSGLSTGRHRR